MGTKKMRVMEISSLMRNGSESSEEKRNDFDKDSLEARSKMEADETKNNIGK